MIAPQDKLQVLEVFFFTLRLKERSAQIEKQTKGNKANVLDT